MLIVFSNNKLVGAFTTSLDGENLANQITKNVGFDALEVFYIDDSEHKFLLANSSDYTLHYTKESVQIIDPEYNVLMERPVTRVYGEEFVPEPEPEQQPGE